MHQPFLIGTSVYLRTIEESDITEFYQQWFNDGEICQFNSHHRFPMCQEDMHYYYQNVIKSKENLVLAIIEKSGDRHVGNIALQNISSIDRSAELAIIIGDKNYWHKGVGYEAGCLIIDHGFTALNLHRIYCGTSSENKGMQKLATKLLFQQEGVSREALFKNSIYRDIITYGLLVHEYKK